MIQAYFSSLSLGSKRILRPLESGEKALREVDEYKMRL
jgi:hypothetical protein